MLKILEERGGVDPNRPDIYGKTPPLCVAHSGYQGVVKILLERGDINPDKPDKYHQTPLS